MKLVILISLTLLMSACDDQEEKLKQEQEKAAVEALISIPPQPIVLPEMKTKKIVVD